MDDATLFAQFVIEFNRLCAADRRIQLDLSLLDCWSLVGTIQLACRHPENTGPTRQIAERIARTLQPIVAPGGALAIVAERGWDEAYDVPFAATTPDGAARQAEQAATLAERFQALFRADTEEERSP